MDPRHATDSVVLETPHEVVYPALGLTEDDDLGAVVVLLEDLEETK
jgi:hypothetical protein